MKWIMVTIVTLAFLLCGAQCKPVEPVCEPNSTRCAESKAQLCNPDGQWITVMDCAEVTTGTEAATWTCQSDAEVGHTCLPAAEEEGPNE